MYGVLQLPIYAPSEEEQQDSQLYAQNVRQYMVCHHNNSKAMHDDSRVLLTQRVNEPQAYQCFNIV